MHVFQSIKQMIHDALEELMQHENDRKTLVEPLAKSRETLNKLQAKKEELKKEIEKRNKEIENQSKITYDIVQLHKQHTSGIVFASSSINKNHNNTYLFKFILQFILKLFQAILS
ncbi:hypothetical protein ABK040_006653 [Willaertia magna]